jgi:sporulation protein YunB
MKKRIILRLSIALTIVIFGVALGIICYENRIKPLLSSYAGAKAVSDTTAAMNRAFSSTLPHGVNYDSLITVNRNQKGDVESLTADTARINAIKSDIVTAAARELESLPALRTKIPIGTLLPFSFLYGKGPAMTFYSIPSGGLTAEFSNTFTSAGINYTLHRIVLTLKVTVTVVMPGERIEKEVAADFFIAETVLSGSIPDIYISQENGG